MGEVGSRGPGGRISILGYDDPWGEREYLYTFTDICDRAGCHCVGDRVSCNIDWGIFFVPDFYQHYSRLCLAVCECFEEDSSILSVSASETSSIASNDTRSSMTNAKNYQTDWAAQNAEKMRSIYSHIPSASGLQNGRDIEDSAPPGTSVSPNRIYGSKPCLAGEAAGWTFQNFANGHCCPGYTFNRLSASEAYGNYGLPIGDIVSGIWVVGVCLKILSG